MAESLGAVCRCFCGRAGGGKSVGFDGVDAPSRGFDNLFEVKEEPPISIQDADAPLFLATPDQPLRGDPTKVGQLWHLQDEERIEPVTFSLFVNGFTVQRGGCGDTEVVSFPPFTLVRNCTLQVGTATPVDTSELKIFKLSFFTRNTCTYYGVKAPNLVDAETERKQWVAAISKAVQLVTQSLYPPFSISCQPVSSAAATSRRLMAGFLLYHEGDQVVSLLYCELRPHCSDSACARLVFYENERCQRHVMTIYITVQTKCFEKIGIGCSCFSLDEHNFSTRSCAERKLWLRAVSNVRVKLQNEAPTPTPEELHQYREAIEEHILSIKDALEGFRPVDPLLQQLPRCQLSAPAPLSPPSARGLVARASPARSPGQLAAPAVEGGSGMTVSPTGAPEAEDCQDGGTGSCRDTGDGFVHQAQCTTATPVEARSASPGGLVSPQPAAPARLELGAS